MIVVVGKPQFSNEVRRNYVLDILLQFSGRSQTYVQQHCGIGRLTHVATKELVITGSQAEAIVDVVYDELDMTGPIVEIAKR